MKRNSFSNLYELLLGNEALVYISEMCLLLAPVRTIGLMTMELISGISKLDL